jgi:hypothetical protein
VRNSAVPVSWRPTRECDTYAQDWLLSEIGKLSRIIVRGDVGDDIVLLLLMCSAHVVTNLALAERAGKRGRDVGCCHSMGTAWYTPDTPLQRHGVGSCMQFETGATALLIASPIMLVGDTGQPGLGRVSDAEDLHCAT